MWRVGRPSGRLELGLHGEDLVIRAVRFGEALPFDALDQDLPGVGLRFEQASDVRRAAATLGWDPYYGDRSTQLAIVGLDLDPDSLHRRLEECLLTDLELSSGEEVWRNLPDPFASMFEEDSQAT